MTATIAAEAARLRDHALPGRERLAEAEAWRTVTFDDT
jgi:hypothetical protein